VGIRHDIDETLGLTVVVWDGDISEQEAVDHLVRIAQDPRWPPGRRHLADIRTLGRAEMPPRELLEELIAGTDVRRAVERVVVARPTRIGSGNIPLTAASLGMTTTPFSDLDEACAYLGVEPQIIRGMIDSIRAELAESQSPA